MDTLNGTYISIKRPSTYRATSTAPRIWTQISAPTVQEQMRSVDSQTCTVHNQKSKMSLTPVHVHTAFLGDTEWHLHYNENHHVPTERHPQHDFAHKLFVVSEQMNILYTTARRLAAYTVMSMYARSVLTQLTYAIPRVRVQSTYTVLVHLAYVDCYSQIDSSTPFRYQSRI